MLIAMPMIALVGYTIVYLSAFALASVVIAAAIVILGTSGVLFTFHEFFSREDKSDSDHINTKLKSKGDLDETRYVQSLPDLDIADPSNNSDMNGPRLENPFAFHFKWIKVVGITWIIDERDLPLVGLLISTCMVLIPMALLCYVLFLKAHFAVAVSYGFIYQYIRIKHFMHGLLHFRHFASHRPLFHSHLVNMLPNIFLDPLMGIPPLVFRLHHPIMHHIGNNGKYDISSTEIYQRDNWYAFARYWFRFQVEAYYELPKYAWTTGRRGWCVATVTVIGAFLIFLTSLSHQTSGWATFFAFGMPWLVDHASDAVRNWCQHMFVLPVGSPHAGTTGFHHNCGLTYNIIDDEHNRHTYNEGYHVIHHSWANCHWSYLPNKFYKEVKALQSCPLDVWCLTFRNTSIWSVFLHTVTPRKLEDFIAKHYVHVPTMARPKPPTTKEVAQELRRRCAPINQDAKAELCKTFARI